MAVAVGVELGAGVLVGLGLTVGVGEGLRVAVGVGVFVGVKEGDVVGVGEGVLVGVGVSVLVGVGEGLTVAVGVGVSVGVGLGDKVPVGVRVGVSLGVGETVSVGDGVSVSVGVTPATGSTALAKFWGWEPARTTKSLALLSVSSPFPANSSPPPLPIDSAVELLLAFRSMLPLAEGVAAAAPSTSPAVPIPTLSMTASVSSINSTVLLAAIPLEVAVYATSALAVPV